MTTDYLHVIVFNDFISYAAAKGSAIVARGSNPTNGDVFFELSKLLSALSPKTVYIVSAEETIKAKTK